MRLALVGPTYPFRGGIAHHTTRLYYALKTRHTVEFVTFHRQYPRWLFPGRTDRDPSRAPAAPIAAPLLDPLNPITWWQTASYIKEQHPDALIMPWWVAFWAPAFATIGFLVKRSGTRLIFVCHNLVAHEARPGEEWLTRLALGQSDGFVIQSVEDGAMVSKFAPRARIQYVPHPIYAEENARRDVPSERRADQIPCLLFFGFVRPYKGLRVLLEALLRVLEQKPVHLIVAGEFWGDRREYERRIRELNIEQAVTLLDRYIPNEELGALFAQADLAILPYVSVTSSAVLGMVVGQSIPVVVSEVGDLGTLVRENEIGQIAAPGDPTSLARAILNCLEPAQLTRYRRNVARMREDAALSWERLVEAIETLARRRPASA